MTFYSLPLAVFPGFSIPNNLSTKFAHYNESLTAAPGGAIFDLIWTLKERQSPIRVSQYWFQTPNFLFISLHSKITKFTYVFTTLLTQFVFVPSLIGLKSFFQPILSSWSPPHFHWAPSAPFRSVLWPRWFVSMLSVGSLAFWLRTDDIAFFAEFRGTKIVLLESWMILMHISLIYFSFTCFTYVYSV